MAAVDRDCEDDGGDVDHELHGGRHRRHVGADVERVGDDVKRAATVEHWSAEAPRIRVARPWPVTSPSRAAVSWTAAATWRDHDRRPQQRVPEGRADLGVGADAGRVVVGRAGDQAGPESAEVPMTAQPMAAGMVAEPGAPSHARASHRRRCPADRSGGAGVTGRLPAWAVAT